jgi:hypothetical protein
MEDLLVNKEQWIVVDPGTQPTGTDPGDQIFLKIQSARNRFKSNRSVGLVVTNPTQLIWVQTDVG